MNLDESRHPPNSKKKINLITSLVVNFRSLNNKIPLFSTLISETDPDIIFGTETWLKPGTTDSELLIPDYDIFRNDRLKDADEIPTNLNERKKETGGGVMICIKKTLNSQLLFKSKTNESIFCRINQQGKAPTVLGCVYRPPDSDLKLSQTIANEIYETRSKFKKSVFLIGGDFNLPDINWDLLKPFGNKYLKSINETFLDAFQDSGLHQIVSEPTRENTILDLFLTSNPNLSKNTKVISGLGDHEAVLNTSLLNLPRKKTY